MAEYLLGVVTIPALLLIAFAVLLLTEVTPTDSLGCGCGKDWGNPHERHWRRWWQVLVLAAHDRSRQHRAWWRSEDGAAFRANYMRSKTPGGDDA